MFLNLHDIKILNCINMELRKLRNNTPEFVMLHAKLTELGLYENGMNLEQMRQVMGAVDESINETSFSDRDMEFALRASEKDFASANICNSTMIGVLENSNVLDSSSGGLQQRSPKVFSSSFSSPEGDCIQKVTVVAEVHHELDWTPTKSSHPTEEDRKHLVNKRVADANSQDDSGVLMSSSNCLFETTSL